MFSSSNLFNCFSSNLSSNDVISSCSPRSDSSTLIPRGCHAAWPRSDWSAPSSMLWLDQPYSHVDATQLSQLPCGHVTGERGRQMADSLSPTGNPQIVYKSSCFGSVFEIFRSVETEETENHPKFFIYIYPLWILLLDLEKFSKIWSRDWRQRETDGRFSVSDGKSSDHI